MSIEAITGLTGSSKTYHFMMEVLIPSLREGRYVITNISGVNPNMISGLFRIPLDVCERLILPISNEEMCSFWSLPRWTEMGFESRSGNDFENIIVNCPKNAVIGIDEAHKKFGTADHSAGYLKDFFVFLTVHRKLGLRIVLITQKIANINSKVLNLVQQTHYLQASALFGGHKDKYIHRVYEESFEGVPSREMNKYHHMRDSKVYHCYISREDGVIDDKPSTNIWNRPSVYVPVALLVLCVIFAVPSVLKVKNNGTLGNEPKPEKALSGFVPTVSDSSALLPRSVFFDGVRIQ